MLPLRVGVRVGSLCILTTLCIVAVVAAEPAPQEESWAEDFDATPTQLHTSSTQQYAGHSVVRFALTSPAAKSAFNDAVQHHGLDVWDEVPGSHAVVRVPPTVLLSSIPVPHRVLNPDIAAALIQEQGDTKIGFHGKYHSVDEIKARLAAIVKANPKLVSMEVLSHSSEQRPVHVLHIKAKGSPAVQAKAPIVFIQAGQHAREWIAPAAALYAIDQLVDVAKKGGGLPGYQVSLVALMNPDGYHHTFSQDRMWRKNRAVLVKDPKALTLLEASTGWYNRKQCVGVDLNRNWGSHWAQTKQSGQVVKDSTTECRDTFQGLQGMSQPEVKGVVKHVLKQSPRVVAFMDVHSFSEKLLPPGCNGWAPKKADAEKHARVGDVMIQAMNTVGGGQYSTGPCIQDMYECSGTAGDWGYQQAKIQHSYSLELRPTSAIDQAPRDKDGQFPNGFVAAPDQIVPTGKELFAGITALAHEAIKE